MAYVADPVLLAPTSISEACLRIQEAMRGAKAHGKLITHRIPDRITNILFDVGRTPALMTYEFDSVDVTEFLEHIERDREGRLKRPGCGTDNSSPFVYDDYCHEDVPGDEVVFTIPDSGNPHFGKTGPRPTLKDEEFDVKGWWEAQLEDRRQREEAIARLSKKIEERTGDAPVTAEDLVSEFQERTGVTITESAPEAKQRKVPEIPPADITAQALHASTRRGYKPMKSGVWLEAGVNEDDIVAAHPDPVLDKVYEEKVDASKDPQAFYDRVHGDRLSFEPNPTLETKVDRLTEAIESLVGLLKAG